MRPVLLLPRGSYDPNKYVKVAPSETRGDIDVISSPGYHREKALAVVAQVGGRQVLVPGGGVEYTEDLKDLVERMREEDQKTKGEREAEEKERLQAVLNRWADHFTRKIELHKRNPRTRPDPKHVIPKEKRFW